jgi:hypothetical protein
MFVYGCLSSVAALVWLIVALISMNVHGLKLWLIETLFIVHGCVLVLTFHRDLRTVLWPTVLQVTSKRTMAAKIILLLAIANVIAWLSSIFVLALQNGKPLAEWALSPFLASCALLSTVYVAMHWAFRPENLFPRGLMQFAANPFGAIVRKLVR